MLDFELVIFIRCLLSLFRFLCCWGEGNSVPRNGTHDKKSFCFILLSVFSCLLSDLVLLRFWFEPVKNALKSDHRTKIILNFGFDQRTLFQLATSN